MKTLIACLLLAFTANAQTIYKPIYNGLLQANLNGNGFAITNLSSISGATNISGDGSALTNLNASSISSGTLATNRFPSGALLITSALTATNLTGPVPVGSLGNVSNLTSVGIGGGLAMVQNGPTNIFYGQVQVAGSGIGIISTTNSNGTVTNTFTSSGGGGFVGLTNYMLQAQTNFISTTLYSDANFYSLFTNANSTTASGTIEITITNGTTHYPSLVADYAIFVDKAPIIVQRSFAYNDITIGLRASNDGISQSKLDVFFDSSPFGYSVKFYGQNCFGGGAITQTNNSASLGTAYVFTPSETSQIYSGTLTATLFVGSLTGDISGNANSAGRLNDANGDPALTANSDPNIITIEAGHFLSGSGSGLTGIPSTGITGLFPTNNLNYTSGEIQLGSAATSTNITFTYLFPSGFTNYAVSFLPEGSTLVTGVPSVPSVSNRASNGCTLNVTAGITGATKWLYQCWPYH